MGVETAGWGGAVASAGVICWDLRPRMEMVLHLSWPAGRSALAQTMMRCLAMADGRHVSVDPLLNHYVIVKRGSPTGKLRKASWSGWSTSRASTREDQPTEASVVVHLGKTQSKNSSSSTLSPSICSPHLPPCFQFTLADLSGVCILVLVIVMITKEETPQGWHTRVCQSDTPSFFTRPTPTATSCLS